MTKLLVTLSLGFVLVLFPPATMAVVSNNAVPGDSTYPIKRGLEDVIYAVASLNPNTKALFAKARSDRRFQEITVLLTQGKKVSKTLNELVEQTQVAADQINQVSDPNQKGKLISQLSDSITKYDQGLSQVQPPIPTQTPTPAPSIVPSPTPDPELERTRKELEEIKKRLEELEKQRQIQQQSQQNQNQNSTPTPTPIPTPTSTAVNSAPTPTPTTTKRRKSAMELLQERMENATASPTIMPSTPNPTQVASQSGKVMGISTEISDFPINLLKVIISFFH